MKIIRDVFPAHLSVAAAGVFTDPRDMQSFPPLENTQYVDKTRIVMTDEAILVASDSPSGPIVIFQEQYIDYFKSKKDSEDSYVITKSGKMLAFKKDSACGCGSRLRSWHAYNTIVALGY